MGCAPGAVMTHANDQQIMHWGVIDMDFPLLSITRWLISFVVGMSMAMVVRPIIQDILQMLGN